MIAFSYKIPLMIAVCCLLFFIIHFELVSGEDADEAVQMDEDGDIIMVDAPEDGSSASVDQSSESHLKLDLNL